MRQCPALPEPPVPPACPVVVITGASSGIGRCTALLFARRGWHVGLIARGQAGLADVAACIAASGGRAATACADVSDAAALDRAATAVMDALGPADAWINCAGNGVYGRFHAVPQEEFDRVTAVTYGGTVNGTRTALSHMRPRGHGRIVNVCSAIAFHGMPLMSSYAGAKAAVRGFCQALRAELAIERSRIRVSAVFPPAVNTPFFSHAVTHMGHPSRPAPPVYQPEVVAAGIYFAATTGRAEVIVSGTALAFSWICRLSPAFVAVLMRMLGFDKQLTHDPAACLLMEPTLFEPSASPGQVHGPFGRGARRTSVQFWVVQALSAAAGTLARFIRRQASRWQPRPVPPAPRHGHVGSAPLPGVSSDTVR